MKPLNERSIVESLEIEFKNREWKILKGYFHPVKIRDVLQFDIWMGELLEIKKTCPIFTASFKSLFLFIKYQITTYRQRLNLYKKCSFVRKNLKQPSILKEPETSGNIDPSKIPFTTWFDEIVHMFGAAYGWSMEQVLNFPYCMVNDQRLVIEYHASNESSKNIIESNPTDDGIEELHKYPIRDIITPEIQDQIWTLNRRKYMSK